MVYKIIQHGPSYYWATHNSAQTAQTGHSFAQDAIAFFKRLFQEESREIAKSGLDNIKEVAEKAYQDANEMHKRFNNVLVELFKVRFVLMPAFTYYNEFTWL